MSGSPSSPSCVVCVCTLQQRPLQRLNEDLVNMHEGRALPFTSVTSSDAVAQRKMERNGKSKKLNSYLVPHAALLITV